MKRTGATTYFAYRSHGDGTHTITRRPLAPSDHLLLTRLTDACIRYVLPLQLLCLALTLLFGATKPLLVPIATLLCLLMAVTAVISVGCAILARRGQTLTITPTSTDLTPCFNVLRAAQRILRDEANDYDRAAWVELQSAQRDIAAAEQAWPGADVAGAQALAYDHALLRGAAEGVAIEGFVGVCAAARDRLLKMEEDADDESEAQRIRAEMDRSTGDDTFA